MPMHVLSYWCQWAQLFPFTDSFSLLSHVFWSLSDMIAMFISQMHPFSTTIFSVSGLWRNSLFHLDLLPTTFSHIHDMFSPFALTLFAVTGQPRYPTMREVAFSSTTYSHFHILFWKVFQPLLPSVSNVAANGLKTWSRGCYCKTAA